MSSSKHPIAIRLERQVGGATRLLATVMILPLVDGIFPALILAGAMDNPIGILQVGLLVFGGSATLAVILAEMEGEPREQLRSVATVGAIIIVVAAAEAALAPTIKSVLNLEIFERFAAIVIAAVAAKTASSTIGDYLPRPAIIVGLGMVASFQPAGAKLVTVPDPMLILKGAAAAAVGAGFAISVVLFGAHLRTMLDIDRFRFGSAVALGVLPLSLLGLAPGNAPLAVLLVTGLLALDPSGTNTVEAEQTATEAIADGGQNSDSSTDHSVDVADTDADTEEAYGYPNETTSDEREPWL